ncbi:hypothetical protein TWF569_011068 [Orbilia oligospora]|uniref:F-box domain-containing protein n=1 Tax=Orbilia oligospora TaxID=2813651 RepID=A0A7C8N238_ORBOL|nr:hypothetical protein TWF102_003271 [Orbilia oligospora]KAF3094091.1 hypothetical protein TWF706_008623 [Orbilia oligospora]KAF3096084.1 hypothetical protein TWF103_009977 [Orbilia oligospora]KAF3131912.1 hypothetical protein TWF569_011068 [Orbilia oligospora]KAF3131933.1 hypothetical protein TWF594_009651 [Orbilia oligospora]
MKLKISPFEQLPDELISHIITFLDIPSVISLHRVSSRIRSVSRFDGLVWRVHCFPTLTVPQSRCTPSHCPPTSPSSFSSSYSPKPKSVLLLPSRLEKVTIRSHAQWYDASDEERGVDWYKEYQYRHAPLHDESFIKFDSPDNLEIVDIAIAGGAGSGMNHLLAASALGDGSVCIFSLSDSKIGSILGRSKPDLLARKSPDLGSGRLGDGIITGVHHERGLFVNAATAYNHRAWFGAGSVLTEVDLTTMQRIRSHRFPFSVTCLSTPMPVLAVGTTLTLHLLDSRSFSDYVATTSTSCSSDPCHSEKIDPVFTDSGMRKASTRLYGHSTASPRLSVDVEERNSRDYLLHAPPTAFLQPSPLSILHSPIDQGGGNELYVAGRFPSIMAYDRRQWPRLVGTMHSGARLSSLAIIPSNSALPMPSNYTLIGCGEYAGRGTLEMYPLPISGPIPRFPDGFLQRDNAVEEAPDKIPLLDQKMFAKSTSAATRNRQSASRSKIFSVASQGIKVVTGDSEGRLRFMERDGTKHIRDWVGPWGNSFTGGGCVKRILPILHPQAGLKPLAENSDLLLHVGEGAGVLTFNPSLQRNRTTSVIAPSKQEISLKVMQEEEEKEEEEEEGEKVYIQAMRAALETHGSDLQFLQRLGM